MSEDELLQQAHLEVNDAVTALADREIERGRATRPADDESGTIATDDGAVERYIREIIGFDGATVNLLFGGIIEQVNMATSARKQGAPQVSVYIGLFLSGFAHGKRFAELRELASREDA